MNIDIEAFVQVLVEFNESWTGNVCGEANRNKLVGCLASFEYYNDIQQQIASIVCSIIKNHCFVDGNKRTALIAYDLLCEINGLSVINNDIVDDVIVQIAGNKLDVQTISDLLFPRH